VITVGTVRGLGKNRQEGGTTVDEGERVAQVLLTQGKHQVMMVLELHPGHAEPELTLDHQVRSVPKGKPVRVINPAGRPHR